MRRFGLVLAAGALASVSATPAPAYEVFFNSAFTYLGPELHNHLTAPGPARCTWADKCWYVIARGPDVVVAPAPAVTRKKAVRTKN